jgi:hypothetical protein
MLVRLTAAEWRGIDCLARGRNDKPGTRKFSRHSDLDVHRMGLAAEYAVSKWLHIPVDISITERGDAGSDLRLADGRTVQVKYRNRRGGDFALYSTNPAEFKADLGVLCWPAQEGIEIVGTITRERFLQVAHTVNYGYGARLAARAEDFVPAGGKQT